MTVLVEDTVTVGRGGHLLAVSFDASALAVTVTVDVLVTLTRDRAGHTLFDPAAAPWPEEPSELSELPDPSDDVPDCPCVFSVDEDDPGVVEPLFLESAVFPALLYEFTGPAELGDDLDSCSGFSAGVEDPDVAERPSLEPSELPEGPYESIELGWLDVPDEPEPPEFSSAGFDEPDVVEPLVLELSEPPEAPYDSFAFGGLEVSEDLESFIGFSAGLEDPEALVSLPYELEELPELPPESPDPAVLDEDPDPSTGFSEGLDDPYAMRPSLFESAEPPEPPDELLFWSFDDLFSLAGEALVVEVPPFAWTVTVEVMVVLTRDRAGH